MDIHIALTHMKANLFIFLLRDKMIRFIFCQMFLFLERWAYAGVWGAPAKNYDYEFNIGEST